MFAAVTASSTVASGNGSLAPLLDDSEGSFPAAQWMQANMHLHVLPDFDAAFPPDCSVAWGGDGNNEQHVVCHLLTCPPTNVVFQSPPPRVWPPSTYVSFSTCHLFNLCSRVFDVMQTASWAFRSRCLRRTEGNSWRRRRSWMVGADTHSFGGCTCL